MASAHGAGFMVLPVLLGSFAKPAHSAHMEGGMEARSLASPMAALMNHGSYDCLLAVTGLIAWIVYKNLVWLCFEGLGSICI
jgi:hypothetical protein